MKIVQDGEVLSITEINRLGSADSSSFQSQVGPSLPSEVKQIEIDLSQTDFLDCGGLGALIAVRKQARHRNPALTVKLLNPSDPIRRILKLRGMDQL